MQPRLIKLDKATGRLTLEFGGTRSITCAYVLYFNTDKGRILFAEGPVPSFPSVAEPSIGEERGIPGRMNELYGNLYDAESRPMEGPAIITSIVLADGNEFTLDPFGVLAPGK